MLTLRCALLLVAVGALLRALAFLLVAVVALRVRLVLVDGLAEAFDLAAGLGRMARRALQALRPSVLRVIEGDVPRLGGKLDRAGRRRGGSGRGEGEGDGNEHRSEGLGHVGMLLNRGAAQSARSRDAGLYPEYIRIEKKNCGARTHHSDRGAPRSGR